ncbi:ABC transporter permease [Leuconostoc gelidum subsp. gelidum]|uniref:ABC transporter permease n=1 Tax=Leuconostoc gelidum TaxID=1244 RepID=UPI001CC6BF5E|nr:ABC transporter permease [Leuconostoc gelidum]MBZ6014252.1 ABC transporter permease [Leuconostoc gelidum subsp. gelidum]
MITKLITVEHLKMRRTYIWFMLLIGTIIGCGLGLFLYLANLNAFVNTNNQFLALWGEFNIFSSQIFIPLFLAIIVGINVQTEKSNRMLNSLRTMSIKPSFIFVSKSFYLCN